VHSMTERTHTHTQTIIISLGLLMLLLLLLLDGGVRKPQGFWTPDSSSKECRISKKKNCQIRYSPYCFVRACVVYSLFILLSQTALQKANVLQEKNGLFFIHCVDVGSYSAAGLSYALARSFVPVIGSRSDDDARLTGLFFM